MSAVISQYKFCKFADKDVNSICDLYFRAFSKKFSPETYAQMTFNNPFGPSLNIGLRSKGGDIIAHFCATPIAKSIKNDFHSAYLTYGLAICPKYQHKGLGYYLIQEMLQRLGNVEACFTYCFTNSLSFDLLSFSGYKKLDDYKIFHYIGDCGSKNRCVDLTPIAVKNLDMLLASMHAEGEMGLDVKRSIIKWRFQHKENLCECYIIKSKINGSILGYFIIQNYGENVDLVDYHLFNGISDQDNERYMLSALSALVNVISDKKKLLCLLSNNSALYKMSENYWVAFNSRAFPLWSYSLAGDDLSGNMEVLPSETDYFW